MEDKNKKHQIFFDIQKIYTKNISFEAPNTPRIFKSKWNPDTKVDIDTRSIVLHENINEVELTLTITVTNNNITAYLVEVTQSGIFNLSNLSKEQSYSILNTFCPTTLFPYAKYTIENLINKGGFPQINLQPINFDILYNKKYINQSIIK